MNPPPPLPQLAVRCALDKAHTFDLLEAILAIARRGGLQLGTLQLRARADADAAYFELRAADAELLELFMARLSNVIGVTQIARIEQDRTAASPAPCTIA